MTGLGGVLIMYSRNFVILLICTLSGCGLLGKNEEFNKYIEFSSKNSGCLNGLGDRFKEGFEGRGNTQQWEASWDCLIDTLKTFKQYVKPGSNAGYTLED